LKKKKIPEKLLCLKYGMFSPLQHGKFLEEHLKNPKTAQVPKKA
jgi:hypothetical protein